MRNYRTYIFFALFFLACLSSRAQTLHSISGNVSDESNLPLRGASIFLTGRLNNTISDLNGNFSLSNLRSGNYNLVITMIGYKTMVKDVTIHDQDIKLTLQLEQQVTYLNAVTVKPDKSRLEYLEIFKKQFLGESENASHCKILNSEILNFTYDNKAQKLTAGTDEVLTIKSESLGYLIKYVLVDFVYYKSRNAVIYQGYPAFEELKGTPEEEAQWKINRRVAFLGSIHQFIRSVYEENCRASGFTVYKIKNRMPLDSSKTGKNLIRIDYKQVSFDSLLTVKDEHFKTLNFKDALYVIFTKGKEQAEYANKNYSLAGIYSDRWLPEGQVSIVNLFGPVSIDENGFFKPTSNLFFEGYMGWEKIADLVPYEYNPAEEN
jgi:CarboxypepD_reg-like domain